MDRQYRLALLIILIPLITLAASTLTYYFGYKPSEINANGTPIEPKIQTQNLNLIDEDGKKFALKKLIEESCEKFSKLFVEL